MSTTKIFAIIAVVLFACVLGAGAIVGGMYFHYSNLDVELRAQAKAKAGACMTAHDEMKQSVKEIGGVADAYMAGFDSMYTHIISSRYSKGDGTLMKWIQESNPQFDNSLNKKLADKIEIARAEFKVAQDGLLDVQREHTAMIRKAPARWFLNPNDTIEVKLVLGSNTRKAFETGVDDDYYKAGKK